MSKKINSRQKGARGEREAAATLAAVFGVAARRGRQFSGSPDSPDVVADLPGVHFEIKRVERLNIETALDQATRDAGGKIPVVMHKKNRRDWLFSFRVADAPRLIGILYDILNNEAENEDRVGRFYQS